MALMETALDSGPAWNKRWQAPLFHEVGVLFLTRGPMPLGSFEYESYRLLLPRGHQPTRLDSNEIRRRFPAWNADRYVDGYFNPEGGYAESAQVVTTFSRQFAMDQPAHTPGAEPGVLRVVSRKSHRAMH